MVDWTTFISPALVIVAGAIGYGKLQGDLTGRIKGQEITLARHEDSLEEHGTQISELQLQSARSEGFQAGFKAANTHSKRE